jgi:hypothetical protein
MKNLKDMTPEEFKASRPTEDELPACEWELQYRKHCEARGEDYRDEEVRESYMEAERARNEPMDENDQEGWEHNFHKALEERD